MKTVSVRELQTCIKDCVNHAQKDCVIITRHGRPAAVIVGVEGKEWDELVKDTTPELARHLPHRPRRPAVARPEKAKPVKPAKPSEFMQAVRRFIPGL